MKKSTIIINSLALLVATVLLLGCQPQAPLQPPPPTVVYSLPELKYRLLSNFGEAFWCDPDFYPVGRPGQEEKNALEQFPAIRADAAEFAAVTKHLGLPVKADYTLEEKLLVYRERKKLAYGVRVTAAGVVYSFVLRVGEGQGSRIEGTITPSAEITVQKKEPSFNTCPICLTHGVLIDTPSGPTPVEQVQKGMLVWTLDFSGQRVAAPVLETAITPIPASFQVVRLSLEDGRTVTASSGHPTAEGKALGDFRVGDSLDGASVAAADRVVYEGAATYDILPAGSGLYWANGVLLKSTLAPR